MELVIAKEYSDITGLRYSNIMDYSGEDFYHKKLNEAFANAYRNGEELVLVFDGSLDGYSPSFVDEEIGNLVFDFSLAEVEKRLKIVSKNDARWLKLVCETTYPAWEKRRINKQEPTITESHGPWYRLVNGRLEEKIWIEYS